MKCFPTLLPVITNIVNRSLEGAFMPNALKCTMITPLLKKSNLDPEEFKNFSSVSNLPFTSKFIEKTVAAQLMQNIGKNNLSEKLQSAYKKLHSTETTLLKVQDDILRAVDNGGTAVLLYCLIYQQLLMLLITVYYSTDLRYGLVSKEGSSHGSNPTWLVRVNLSA